MTADGPIPMEYARAGRPDERRRRRVDRPPRTPAGEAVYWFLDRAGWVGATVIVLVTLVGAFTSLFGGIGGPVGLIVVGLLLGTTAAAAAAARRRRGDAVLAYVAQAVRLGHPVDGVCFAAAAGERGRLARRLGDLATDLRGGLSLTDAVAAVPEVTPRQLGLVAVAEQTNRLPQTLARLVRDDVDAPADAPENRAFAAAYPVVLTLVLTSCVGLFAIFVAPKFAQLFKDFHVKLPTPTRWLIDSQDDLGWVVAAAAIAYLFYTAGKLRQTFTRGRRTWLLRGWIDRVRWVTPLVGAADRDRGWADVCRTLADFTEAGRPLDAAVAGAVTLDVSDVIRRRLAGWAGGMARGLPPADAARAARLPPLLVGLVGTTGDDPAAVFRFVARFYADRWDVRREVVREAVVPVVTLLGGAAVAVVAVGVFLAVTRLIDAATPPSMRGL